MLETLPQDAQERLQARYVALFDTSCGSVRPKGKTIHRVELDGDYEPGNCKWATAHEQALQSRLPDTNKSGYRGVHFYRGAWIASITCNDERMYLGRYKTKEEAAWTYNQAAIVHFGAEAMLNAV